MANSTKYLCFSVFVSSNQCYFFSITEDDANVPSLLSIPYLNYTEGMSYFLHSDFLTLCYIAEEEVFQNTRKLIWSTDNTWFFSGQVWIYVLWKMQILSINSYFFIQYAEGIGSSHTGRNMVWHMSMIMKGIISTSPSERAKLIRQLLNTDANTSMRSR